MRATTLWLVGVLLLTGTGVITYSAVVGFSVRDTGAVEAVTVLANDRDVVVRSVVGSPGCGNPSGVDVTETRGRVTLIARTVIPQGTRWDFSCDDADMVVFHTVRLSAPLGDRELIDGTRPDADVTIVDSLGELIGAG